MLLLKNWSKFTYDTIALSRRYIFKPVPQLFYNPRYFLQREEFYSIFLVHKLPQSAKESDPGYKWQGH